MFSRVRIKIRRYRVLPARLRKQMVDAEKTRVNKEKKARKRLDQLLLGITVSLTTELLSALSRKRRAAS